ncbi:MAG TPA: geranylgeranylglycerol-phosphate geranylgeranyltransferase [Thermoplasmata archaeon]|nr:geranylgeranylglycerol-phosphate geranylgeranyltransferase [Thermoplasmata archaeon]
MDRHPAHVRVLPVLRLVRAGNLAVAFVGTLVGAAAGGGFGFFDSLSGVVIALAAAVSTTLATAAGNVLNDLGDRESDRVNHPERPLVTEAVSVNRARGIAVGGFVAGGLVVVPFAVSHWLLPAIYLVAVAVLLAYEFRLKTLGLPGNLAVAALTGAVFLYGGAAAGNVVPLLAFAAMATLATLSRELTKDIEDLAGDIDRTTFPKVHGTRSAVVLARAAIASAIALSAVPLLGLLAIGSGAGIIYLVLVGAADAMFVLSVAWLPGRVHWEQTVSKLGMAVALGAFLAAAFR